ncbi:MAG: ABC transporter permease [Chloroflexi bacterium]|nr:ABC transporter permease [Chloroflexota bacterium]
MSATTSPSGAGDARGDARAPEDSLSRGWLTIARKEFADHVLSARFFILLIVLGLAAVVPLYFVADLIRESAASLSGSPVICLTPDCRQASATFLALFVIAPSDIPIPPVYGFVGIVAPLLGVAFAFDAISGERAEGTLPRLVSQPIHRDDVINGKFLAGLAAITLVLTCVVVVIAGFGIARLGIVPSVNEVLRLVAWLAFAVVWVALWLAFGLLLSVVVRRSATAALAGFGVWLLVAIFGQLVVGLIAGLLAPVGSATTAGDFVSLGALSDTIQRILPLTLYLEGSTALLNPTVTVVGTAPRTVGELQQWAQQVPGTLLPVDQSLLLVGPQVIILVALTVGCFALAYAQFMRQEVRA